MIVSNFINYWLTNIVRFECKGSTLTSYQGICKNHIIPLLGQYKLDEVTYEHIIQFRTTLMDKAFKVSTINKIINCLKIVFTKAHQLEHTTKNRTKDLSFIPTEERDIHILDISTKQALISSESAHRDLYIIALNTGLRLGEIAALRHSDVDLSTKMITVSRTKNRDGFGSTKNKRKRKIPLATTCYEILHRLHNNSDDLIWDIDVTNFTSNTFKVDCKALGIKPLKFHDLRHTFATDYINAGGKITHLSKILGHSSITITMEIYLHIDESALLDDMESINL